MCTRLPGARCVFEALSCDGMSAALTRSSSGRRTSASPAAARKVPNNSRPRPCALPDSCGCGDSRRAQLVLGHTGLERAGDGVEPDDVAVAHARQRAAGTHFGRDVDGRRHLARRAGHAAVGHQRDLKAALLQHAPAAASACAVPACRWRAGPGSAPRRRSRDRARRRLKAASNCFLVVEHDAPAPR